MAIRIMNTQEVIRVAGEHLASLAGNDFDVLTVASNIRPVRVQSL
jgi:hypothetical protein